MPSETEFGQLFVVATPIGNLADMVPRAVETLQTVDLIAAEDTRHSAKLLSHFSISTPMFAYHDHTDERRTELLIEKLRAGSKVALISDAGTPLISDPGYRLVAEARRQGITVTPIPGACALITALSASGLATDRFRFEGFLPSKQQARQQRLQSLVEETATLVYYEAPHRILDCLQDVASVFGMERRVVLARELTKTFETFLAGNVAQVLARVAEDSNQQRGEIVLMIAGAAAVTAEIDAESRRLLALLLPHMPPKKAAGVVAEYTGLKKNALYQWLMQQKAGE
ncbi:16S rRNA (cytidine(1402)-2'-O)-methyltransferase [Halioxenophilus sp. WMMB6]|uniref:16S rRNA (cytidine(1402)-2'-O)-methyltransferase n=1 Tax=Halioxenophilus sp. WMMB6 TaxID=3073815 RepID=UPI00295ED2F2|nr:16S rRNA (cytidine(1402)-2'-O)-methyltransferase [Halioxenophilus sp. WMMB6]